MDDQGNDGLARIILKLTENNPEMRIDKLNTIHPMYEALVALLRQQLTDPEIVTCFSRCDNKESLKSVLFVDTILDEYKKIPSYSNSLKQLLLAGKSISEIATIAALQISENKRVQEGKVIQRVGSSSDKYMMKALKILSPTDVYVRSLEIEKLKLEAHKMYKKRIIGVLAGIVVTAISCLTCYEYGKRSEHYANIKTDLLLDSLINANSNNIPIYNNLNDEIVNTSIKRNPYNK